MYGVNISYSEKMEFLFNIIFWTLAIYGLLEIVKNILYISMYTNFKSSGIHIIVAVKNQEDHIEGFLRSLLFKLLYGKEEYIKKIMVVDLKSTDETRKIVKNMSKKYECIEVLSWKECKDIINNIDET